MINNVKCTQCGAVGLEPGFIEDNAPAGRGDARWVAGPIERGPLGGAKRMGRPHLQVDAFHCLNCGHLEFFAVRPA
ncbi:hypothetical protein [Streptacidiphilus neutrinimicus]|uniref:hypothetical protein n=1 Tax=Streptacidiphilus neutrinimicus TaxID=105420 RepID=UPI000A573436